MDQEKIYQLYMYSHFTYFFPRNFILYLFLKIQFKKKVPDNETSQMSFEGNLIKGQQAIVEKLKVI
jgi:hypothetical protein